MKPIMKSELTLVLSGLLVAATLRAADQQAGPEARLREAVRSSMLQLRDAQNQLAALQSTQAETEQKNKTLTAQVESLSKQGAADRESAAKTIAALNSKTATQEAEIAKLRDNLDKWEAACKKAADVARAKEADRAKLAAEAVVLKDKVADRETQNIELFKLGNEILKRYERFVLGEVLVAREPFTGIARVRLKELVQDYQDKLADQRSKETAVAAPSPTPAGKPGQSVKPSQTNPPGKNKQA